MQTRPVFPRVLAIGLGLTAVIVTGCGQVGLGDGLPDEFDCRSCHGSTQNAAPPANLDGQTATSLLGVGAHQAHLTDGTIRQAIACANCHVAVLRVEQAGHVDSLPAEVTFSGLAWPPGQVPAWDRDQATCQNTYCHGASLAGGMHTAPIWTQVDGNQRACGSCHGNPPPAPHPAGGACADCHPQTVLANGRIDVAGGQHIDGQVDVGGLGCSACHGSDADPAPPVSLDGASDPAEVGVGAHQAHLNDGVLRQALACEECHRVPATVDEAGHTDSDLPAELTWGPLATTAGAQPVWDRDQATCASSYCHGASLSGGSLTTPAWTNLDGISGRLRHLPRQPAAGAPPEPGRLRHLPPGHAWRQRPD